MLKMLKPSNIGVCPTLWALVSSSVIKMCNEATNKIEIATAITKIILPLMGFVFLNNADLAQAASNQDTSREEVID